MAIVLKIIFALKPLMAKVSVLWTLIAPAVLMAIVLLDGRVSMGHVPMVGLGNRAPTTGTAKRVMSVAITDVFIAPVGSKPFERHCDWIRPFIEGLYRSKLF